MNAAGVCALLAGVVVAIALGPIGWVALLGGLAWLWKSNKP
jgi:hypothetical protein